MKQETKAKILAKANNLYNKAVIAGASAAATVGTLAISASAEEATGGSSSGSLSSALSSVDPNIILGAFYEVLPTVLTVALPIIGAKVALNFLFGSIKGA